MVKRAFSLPVNSAKIVSSRDISALDSALLLRGHIPVMADNCRCTLFGIEVARQVLPVRFTRECVLII